MTLRNAIKRYLRENRAALCIPGRRKGIYHWMGGRQVMPGNLRTSKERRDAEVALPWHGPVLCYGAFCAEVNG